MANRKVFAVQGHHHQARDQLEAMLHRWQLDADRGDADGERK